MRKLLQLTTLFPRFMQQIAGDGYFIDRLFFV